MAPPAEAAPAAGPRVVTAEQVVVTARLLTESPASLTRVDLRDTPLSQATTSELSAAAANFFVATNDSHSFNDTFALRGLVNTPIFGAAAVTFYLDDLPLGGPFTVPTQLTGFAHAQLHRGPGQNTVFGRAGSAGVVTLATPEPTVPSGEIRTSYGNFNDRSAAVQAGTGLLGPWDAYLSAGYRAREGYIHNVTLARDIDFKESSSLLARLRYRPTDGSELTLLGTAMRARDGVQPLVPLGGPLFTVDRQEEGQTHTGAYNLSLKAAVALAFADLSATTSFNQWKLDPYRNALALGPLLLANDMSVQQRWWHEEIRLVSSQPARWHWQAGAYAGEGRTRGAFTRAFPQFIYEQSTYRLDQRSLAAFGEASVPLSPAATLTAGLRAEQTRQSLRRQETVPQPQAFARAHRSSALLPKLSISYALTPASLAFVKVGTGYKPGGFSAFTDRPDLAAYGPERTRVLETGVTRTSRDAALQTTLRLFWYDIRGYQIERSFATDAVADDYLVVNAPRARSLGGEAELSWQPAMDGFRVTGALGYTAVTLRHFRDPYTGTAYDGQRAPYVPRFDATLRADYRDPRGWFVGIDLTTTGTTYYTEAENPAFGQRTYSLLGAQAGFTTAYGRVQLYGRNLTDEGYYSAITPGTGHGTPGAPLTYGLEIALQF